GSHTLQISFFFGGFNFSFIEFLTVSTEIDNPDFKNYSFQLEQNFPNPFNPTTQINYSISSASIVIINIYNLNGELIKNIVNEYIQPGNYSVKFDAERLSSGVYLCSMKADNFSDYKKIILLK
ncbi:MAG: T9SS type A sorting domain-containing protein, partial [Ignavibacteriaceae bacterium]|nr:T9SS type A sorting domain-containing protein [Ignavibacteriaceae bacterium]